MAQVSGTETEQLEETISLARLIGAAGVTLTQNGKEMTGACPFHADEAASFTLNPQKNEWHCSSCGAGGGVIEWVMKKNGVSHRHAVELLKEGRPTITDGPVKSSRVRALQAPLASNADERELFKQVIDYYHRCLKTSPEALEYLKARGIHHPELIETFRLGFANRTLGLRLPLKHRKDGREIRAHLEHLGLYRTSGHEHFNGSLVVPIFDERGEVRGAYGRKITSRLRKGTPLHLYVPEPPRGIWNVKALAAASKEIILCQSLIDAMTFWCAGYRNVTASYGPDGFTDEMMEAFTSHGIRRVLIAYRHDAAGKRGAEETAGLLIGAGMECWRIRFPHGTDANDYALNAQPASKSLGNLIRKAEWLGNGKAPVRAAPEPVIEQPQPMTDDASSLSPETSAELPSELPVDEPPPVLPASPMPPAPSSDLDAAVSETQVVISFGARRWRVRGMPKNLAVNVLKVNLMVSHEDAFHVDTLDLYNARARVIFTQQAAQELRAKEDEIKTELGKVLLKLEQVQDETMRNALAPQAPAHPAMTDEARAEAVELLRSPDLLERILADFERCGMVGEATNTLTAYLAATSRKLASPLGVVVQSSSAAGKTSLMDAVLSFIPDEDKVRYSAMTGQSLYYLGEKGLKNKVLAIAEDEGAQRASYALKLLQSEGELTIASTGADANGNLITRDYHVEGPTAIITTTTAINVDEELMNRCLVLAVDEGREQTRAIHMRQREKRTLDGLRARQDRETIRTLHQNAQRLLQPLAVVNPFAADLTFLDDRTRTRRDHEKYLTLIDAIALLHQHQRPIKTLTQGGREVAYIEATASDVERATGLAHEVLGRSLDELPPQTRRVLGLVREMVKDRSEARHCKQRDVRFTRRELREYTGIGDTQLRLHLERLATLEYLAVHSGRQGQSFLYELLHDGGDTTAPHLSGLIDPQALAQHSPMAQTSRGPEPHFAAPSRGDSGGCAGAAREAENAA